MKPSKIYDEVVNGFKERKFAAGLAISFIDFLRHLKVPASAIQTTDDFLKAYPRREFRSPGRRATTLIVDLPDGGTLGLRPFYNAIESFFRAQQKRFDYPSCARSCQSAPGGTTNNGSTPCAAFRIKISSRCASGFRSSCSMRCQVRRSTHRA